ncbi:uncharacterized protein [Montipora capricornis]|uniref:uncharacterized protein n=1 Tax=Montipora capricornis TaxID=246305 RepID=UPI0035F1A109
MASGKKVLFKVWSEDRSKKKFVLAENYAELVSKGKEKLELNSEVEILTEDGTEVDEDIFGELPSSTIFVIKNKVPTPNHEDTTDEGIQTIHKADKPASAILENNLTCRKKAVQKTLCFEGGQIMVGPAVIQGASGASITQTITLDPDKVCRESQIYQLKPDDKLLDYHKAINEAAFDIALKNPTLLCSKLELQKQARTKVHEDGFAYKKKNSRSKEFGSASGSEPKQERTSQDFRQKRIEQLQEDLREVDIQVSYAVKQRERCANVKEFSKALDVSKELDELRKKKRKYQEELTLLQRKESVTKRVKKCRDSKKGGEAAPQADLRQFLKPGVSVGELA